LATSGVMREGVLMRMHPGAEKRPLHRAVEPT
jgi:hypothetical protein